MFNYSHSGLVPGRVFFKVFVYGSDLVAAHFLWRGRNLTVTLPSGNSLLRNAISQRFFDAACALHNKKEKDSLKPADPEDGSGDVTQ